MLFDTSPVTAGLPNITVSVFPGPLAPAPPPLWGPTSPPHPMMPTPVILLSYRAQVKLIESKVGIFNVSHCP